MTSVTLLKGSVVNFKYDPFGRRIFSDGTGRIFVYDGDNVIEDLDLSGKAVARYTQGLGIDEPLEETASGGSDYYEADGLGSISSLTDSTGSVANRYAYSSFGSVTASSSAVSNRFFFTARENVAKTGLLYYRARYYDPQTGRFLSEDPLSLDVSLNFYPYVNNKASNFVDPRGLFGWSDVLPAWNHYCGGTGSPWTANFNSINWGTTEAGIKSRIRAMVGGSCSDRTLPVAFNMGARTAGADAYIIGRHAIRVEGTIKVHCDCTWSFTGDFKSALGYDVYDFDASNRGAVGESLVWIGRSRCPKAGKPYKIYLPGSIGLSSGGRIDGKPTCGCAGIK